MAKRLSRVKEIEQALIDRMDSMKSESGSLPSEPEIAEMFQVSRVTVRQALVSLENKGLVIRKHGLGTFVNQNVLNIQTRLDKAVEFNELIRTAGFEPAVHLISARISSSLEGEIAERLMVPKNTEALVIQKVFTASGTPVIYCIDIIPSGPTRSGLCTPDFLKLDLSQPIYSLLRSQFNESFAYYIADVDVRSADKVVAEALDYRTGAPTLFIEETAYSASDRPSFHSQEFFRPGYIHYRLPRMISYTGEGA